MALYPEANQVDPPKPGLLRRLVAAAKAKVVLLPESRTQPKIKPRVVIMHSAAGKGSLYRFFLRSSNLESHFWVSETGAVEQYMDTNVRADANNRANGFAISIETESSRSATEPWNPVQFEAIVKLVRWCCDTHGIPAVKCPRWDGAGIGWHIQFGAPGAWTPVSKSCPGPARIRQMPALTSAVARKPTPAPAPSPGKWRQFAKGATDAALHAKGGRDNQVSELQMLLKMLGFYRSNVDGVYGPVTLSAVIAAKDAYRWPDRSSLVDAPFILKLRTLAVER